METAEISLGLEGDKLYQVRARKSLPILVRQAKAGQKIYYADLAEEIGIPNPRTLNYPGQTHLDMLIFQQVKQTPKIKISLITRNFVCRSCKLAKVASNYLKVAKFGLIQVRLPC